MFTQLVQTQISSFMRFDLKLEKKKILGRLKTSSSAGSRTKEEKERDTKKRQKRGSWGLFSGPVRPGLGCGSDAH